MKAAILINVLMVVVCMTGLSTCNSSIQDTFNSDHIDSAEGGV